jgi:hypothetical protein
MRKSSQHYAELQAVLQRIRELNANADACRPITHQSQLSPTEQREDERRATKLDQILGEIGKAEATAKTLRQQYSTAMAAELVQQPLPAAPAKSVSEIPRLQKQIAEAEASIAGLPEQRRPHVVAASRGDRKAVAALDQIAASENAALSKIDIAKAAIAEIEAQNTETQREFDERRADECHRAGLAAADAIVVWAEDFDEKLHAIAEHFAKLPELQKALAKSGASINTDLTNRIYTAASRDRAAKAANLHRIFSIDATVAATPLGEAFRSLMRAAVRRPNVERKIA